MMFATPKIVEVAKQLAEAEARVAALGQLNVPNDYKDRIRADARYKLAQDAASQIRAIYFDELKKLTAAELSEIADKM